MKKIIYLLPLLLFPILSIASHAGGGTLGWECLTNGQYRFTMEFYRDCSGIPQLYRNETLQIIGSPLPKDASGNPIDTILLKPDLNRWNSSNNGVLTTVCQGGGGLSCAIGTAGMMQVFWYVSDPITLDGVPPNGTGWTFAWQAAPGRLANSANLNFVSISQGLQAKMFALPNNQNVNPCYDSSPIFGNSPTFSICRDYTFTYNPGAADRDFDSIIVKPDFAYGQDIAGGPLTPVSFLAPYTVQSPTPTTAQNSNNIPYSLDPETGLMLFGIYSGSGLELFATPIRLDAYRQGNLIASVYRESHVSIRDCDPLPNGTSNNPPDIYLNGQLTESVEVDVIAGEIVSIPVQVVDNDVIPTGSGLQGISIIPEGLLFTNNKGPSTDPMAITPRQKGTPCQIPGVEPCAYMEGAAPTLDPVQINAQQSIRGLGTIQTVFEWQTDCKHINSNRGATGTNESIYNFVMKVIDDHCPLPAINYPTITVIVNDPIPLTEPIMKGVSVNLDGSVQYNFVPPIDSVSQFEKYVLEGDRVSSSFPSNWFNVDSDVENYMAAGVTRDFPVYELINPFGPSNGPVDIFRVLGTTQGIDLDFYMRMQTFSGCSDTAISLYSEPARVMELTATPNGNAPNVRSSAVLTWNRAKSLNAQTYPYFIYESATTYYIYSNDSIGNGKISDSASWYLVGETLDTTFSVNGNLCNDFMGYRIEARDTVVSIKAGNSIHQLDSAEIYTFSTFSTIDSLFIEGGTPNIIDVNFTTLESDLTRTETQWLDVTTNSIIPGETTKTFIPQQQGEYRVITSAELNNPICSDTSASFTTIQLSDSVSILSNDSLVAETSGVQYQWYNCRTNQAILGATNQSFVPNDTGLFQVVVKAYGYSDTSACIPILAIGIEENNLQTNVSLFPNPNSGVFYLKGLTFGEEYEISIRNIQGQLIQKQVVSNQQQIELNLTSETGIYFVQLANEKGEQANFKVIKNR